MAIFSTNSTIYQSIRSFPKLTLYGTQSYVKWGRPVMRSLILESPICGGAVLEVHNRGLRKLDLVAQKFFIKKIFFYHIFPFPYKKILNFILVSRSGKIFFICQLEKFYIFLPYIGRAHWCLSLWLLLAAFLLSLTPAPALIYLIILLVEGGKEIVNHCII